MCILKLFELPYLQKNIASHFIIDIREKWHTSKEFLQHKHQDDNTNGLQRRYFITAKENHTD